MKKNLFFFIIISLLSLPCSAAQSDTLKKMHASLRKHGNSILKVQTLLDLSKYYISESATGKQSIDSAVYYCENAKELSLKLKFYPGLIQGQLAAARIQALKGNKSVGKSMVEKALAQAQKRNLRLETGDAYAALSVYYDYGRNNDIKLQLVEKSVSEYRKANDLKALGRGLANLADHYFSVSKYSESISAALEALKLEKYGSRKNLQDIYSVLGIDYNYMGINQESIKYGLLAVKTGEENGDNTVEMGIVYNNIGISYFYLQKYALAQKYHQKGYEYAVKNNDVYWIYTLASNIVNDLIFQKKYTEAEDFFTGVIAKYKTQDFTETFTIKRRLLNIYLKLKKLKLAEKNNNEMLAIAAKSPEELGEMGVFMAHESAIEYYFTVKNFNEARRHLDIIDRNAKKDGAKNLWKRIYSWKFKIDSAQGNYLSAIGNYQKFKTLNDSIIDESKGNQINQLQIQYETEKKDKDISVKNKNIQLLTKEGIIQKTKIAQDRVIRTIIIIVAGLLSLILVLLYHSYRSKQRSNKALESKQEEIETKNISLENLVTEKEWLLKEIHHRVKNNLQIVMSLLNTQSSYLKDKAALTAIRDSQHRVHSMSLIHQKLYKSDNLAEINMPDYIHELVDYLKDSFDLAKRLHFQIDIEDIEMDVSQAVPIGLILNEAITNSIKYAFPDLGEGTITVSLQHSRDDYFILRIADNGIGLPQDFDNRKSNSLGMSLMHGLSGDLDGRFTIKNENGAAIEIEFIYNYSLKNHLS